MVFCWSCDIAYYCLLFYEKNIIPFDCSLCGCCLNVKLLIRLRTVVRHNKARDTVDEPIGPVYSSSVWNNNHGQLWGVNGVWKIAHTPIGCSWVSGVKLLSKWPQRHTSLAHLLMIVMCHAHLLWRGTYWAILDNNTWWRQFRSIYMY